MVEVKEELRDDKPFFTITSAKRRSSFYVSKSNDGFVFYEVGMEKGTVPTKLSGRYTTCSKAVEAVVSYINTQPETKKTRVDNNYAERHPDKV
jgi:hypothetical protein